MFVRQARPEDATAIYEIQISAFPSEVEAELVETLVAAGDASMSLVAEESGVLVGHLLFSRMKVEADGRDIRAVALAPVAVRPETQGRGIGFALIQAALARSEAAGEEMVFVLGEPEYYERFGFSVDTARPFASPYAGEYFMALWFGGGSLPRSGRAEYAPAFAGFEEAAQE